MRRGRGEAAAPASPPELAWPEIPDRTEAGDLLSEVVGLIFQTNGLLMGVADRLAAAGGLSAARWRVLGGVLDEPRTVAEIARRMGMTRQGVQRVADLLVEQGLAELRPNPAHRRAKLLAPSEAGLLAIREIALVQRPWSDRVGAEIGTDELRTALATMRRLAAALAADVDSPALP